jgi:hypothetical protein
VSGRLAAGERQHKHPCHTPGTHEHHHLALPFQASAAQGFRSLRRLEEPENIPSSHPLHQMEWIEMNIAYPTRENL